tara:strand:- start:1277 stop:2131 length:855 start_codon:yes stop_codon:yes gene_type:complete
MKKILKRFIKKVLLKSSLINRIYNLMQINILDINVTFPTFKPYSSGSYDLISKLTILSINQVIPALNLFVNANDQNNLFRNNLEKKLIIPTSFKKKLGELFKYYGSDKSSVHDYHNLYGELLKNVDSIEKIFEIGLGTNNLDIVSSMGKKGEPGASLRAFRDALKSAKIIGADFDKRILFSEERINCFFVDQTDLNTFNQLSKKIGDNFDLMIDDGLHAPNANLHSLRFFLNKLKIGGYAVIEDIHPDSCKEIWDITSALLPFNFNGALIKTRSAYAYVVKRTS